MNNLKTIWRTIAVMALCYAGVSCGSGNDDRMITRERVGRLTFDQKTPDMGKGYITEPDTVYSYEGTPTYCYAIVEKDSVLVARVFPGKNIEVFSPEFKTENGIYPGMKLEEAVQVVGKENLHLYLEPSRLYYTVQDNISGVDWALPGYQLLGGWHKYDKLSEAGMLPEFSDFLPDAVVAWITVTNR